MLDHGEKNQWQSQIEWGVHLFRTFLLFAARRGSIRPTHVIELQKEVEALASEIDKADSHSEVAEALNQVILTANHQIKGHVSPILYSPFPQFSFVKEGAARSAVLDQLDMVERTLTEAAHAECMTWKDEGDLFNDILRLFSVVEQGKLQPMEAMAALGGAIDQINLHLPTEFHLPKIDLTAYEVPV